MHPVEGAEKVAVHRSPPLLNVAPQVAAVRQRVLFVERSQRLQGQRNLCVKAGRARQAVVSAPVRSRPLCRGGTQRRTSVPSSRISCTLASRRASGLVAASVAASAGAVAVAGDIGGGGGVAVMAASRQDPPSSSA